MNALEFLDFPADHFVNSPAVRYFLPIIPTTEETFFDTLTACGIFDIRTAVEIGQAAVDKARDRFKNNATEQLDQFSTEMVIGEHIEAVMSNHDHAR
jgi:hypothetical protein